MVEDHDILFKLSETFHLIGLAILLFKLHQKKSAAGAALTRTSTALVFKPCGMWLLCSAAVELLAWQGQHTHHKNLKAEVFAGLSLRTQNLTATFLGIRLICRFALSRSQYASTSVGQLRSNTVCLALRSLSYSSVPRYLALDHVQLSRAHQRKLWRYAPRKLPPHLSRYVQRHDGA